MIRSQLRCPPFVWLVVSSLAINGVCSGYAADWPQFRGPRFGAAVGDQTLPMDIAPTRHVIWKAELPPGHSSPVIVGQRIFVTGVRDGKQLLTIGLDRATGKVVWEREAPYEKLEAIHRIGSYAQCSPASNGARVVSFFGSSGLYCYDMEGQLQWKVAMGPFNDEFGAASSPLIVEDRVIVGQDHDTGSFLAMYRLSDGQEIWKRDRSEFSRSFGSPVVWHVAGEKQIVVAGMLRVCGYSWDSGEETWTVRGLSRVVCPTPVVGNDNVLYLAAWSAGGDPGERLALEPFPQAVAKMDANRNGTFEKDEITEGPLQTRFAQCDRNKDGRVTRSEYDEFEMLFDRSQNVMLAIRPGGKGDVTDTHVVWKYEKTVPFCASPVLHKGWLFSVKDGGILACVDAKTGRPQKTGRVAAT
ncbi:MAG: PQQ-binding-like beta-propeller repeat protein, partial [Pirellulaceae bacterium]